MTRPRLLFHVQHFLGMGHLVRAYALAAALADDFLVTIVSGGRIPPGITPPTNTALMHLPALGFDAERALVSHEPGRSVEWVLQERQRRLVAIHEALEPEVLLIELFPLGRKKLAGELTALLDAAHSSASPPLIATSVRDLLVTGRHDQQRHDDRAAATLERYFDLVLVHGDRRFVSLHDSFRPGQPVSIPIIYTGFVGPDPTNEPAPPEIEPGSVVVSAGGGWVGGALMSAALDAAPLVADRLGLPTTLITGPLADAGETQRLEARAADLPMVRLVRSVPGLLPTLREAAASVSQAGYNTAVDLVHARVPAVLVPYGDERENEQPRRAAILADHGLAQAIDPADLTGATLADALATAIDQQLPIAPWRVDGAARATTLLRTALLEHRRLAG